MNFTTKVITTIIAASALFSWKAEAQVADYGRDNGVLSFENGTENIRFFAADAGKFMVEAAKANEKFDLVFMDPPRAGSDLNFLRSVVTLSPEKIVYVSCNVETQARDLTYLCKNGYKVKKIQPVDMFPYTNHVENVVLLTSK